MTFHATLEEKHRAVIYLWVHSHVGITPNEAADAVCDEMQLGEFSELDLEPTSFHLVRFLGLKRGVGRAAFDVSSGSGRLDKGVRHGLQKGLRRL